MTPPAERCLLSLLLSLVYRAPTAVASTVWSLECRLLGSRCLTRFICSRFDECFVGVSSHQTMPASAMRLSVQCILLWYFCPRCSCIACASSWSLARSVSILFPIRKLRSPGLPPTAIRQIHFSAGIQSCESATCTHYVALH